MALVAYGNSDDSDYSDSEDESTEVPAVILKTTLSNHHSSQVKNFAIAPNQQTELHDDSTGNTLTFNLPTPIAQPTKTSQYKEDDDEFLKKKPIALEKPPPPVIVVTKKNARVQIVIPALSTFNEFKQKERPMVTAELPARPAGLLNMLPKPKSLFPSSSQSLAKKQSVLVPDSISRPKRVSQAAPSTSSASSMKPSTVTKQKDHSDSDDSDAEDFFSLNTEHVLPEVNMDELNAMVASKSAKINQAIKKYEESNAVPPQSVYQSLEEEQNALQESAAVDAEAIHALCGSRAKRSRNDDIRIIDLSGDQVHPNRDEWLRNQLQATTEYQPRGLVDEEPGAGTKRKHQITYLAHQAKANEQELQAMWAANRHTRRQTQNKYGF